MLINMILDLVVTSKQLIIHLSLIPSSDYLYIQNNKTESISIFEYATRLAKLAIRNWDFIDVGIEYIQGQNTIKVTSTKNLAVGLFVSSGKSYPAGTKIVSIDSETQVTVSNAALANSGGGGGAPSGTTPVSGTGGTITIPTNTAQVPLGSTFSVPLVQLSQYLFLSQVQHKQNLVGVH